MAKGCAWGALSAPRGSNGDDQTLSRAVSGGGDGDW